MYEDIKTIKELANIQIENIFDALGVEYREKYHSLVGPCSVHGGDNKNAFSWHVERGIWKCFSRECDSKYGSDILGLIEGIRKCTFVEAVEWVKKFINLDLSDEEIKEIRDSRSNKDFIISTRRKISQSKTYSWECLKRLAWHDYLVSERKYPEELIKSYHIGACLTPHMYMSNRIVIPVINTSGEIVGFTGRTLHKDWKERKIPKWKHSLGSWVEVNVFNAYRAQSFIQETERAIICEGPLDVLRLEQAGIRNSIAILGKKLHNGQLTALMNMGATHLVFALDNDVAGRIGTSSAINVAECLFTTSILSLPENYNDIGDMSIDGIKEILNEQCCNLS